MSNSRAYLAGIGWSSIFGFSFLVTKGALEAYRPVELLFLRFSLATLVMGLLALFGVLKLSFQGKDPRSLVLACVFQPVLYFLCETFGVAESATSTAGIVLGALPAAVAALGLFMLKERLGKAQVLSLLVSVVGVVLIAAFGKQASGQGEGTLRGLLLLVGALASAAFFNVYSRRASRSYSPAETTFAMMAVGALAFGAASLAQGLLDPPAASLLSRSGPAALLAVGYLGVLSSVLAFFLVNYTLARLKASQSAVFGNLVTLISVAVGILLRDEPFGAVEVAGGAMIVLGVWGTNALRPRPAAPGTPAPVAATPDRAKPGSPTTR